MTQRYPLQWPAGRPRTASYAKKTGRFTHYGRDINNLEAAARVEGELERLGVKDGLLSTNMELRLDGRPRSDRAAPSDDGVCLYFTLKGKPYALACDRYYGVAQNIAAIAAHLEATRAIERHGVATAAEMFTAFEALPAPKTWWEVLGFKSVPLSRQHVSDRFRELAQNHHPDKGGSHAAMAELTWARDQGFQALHQ